MKLHLAWIRATAAAATTIATLGGQAAVGQGQYGPYSTTAPAYAAPQAYAQQRYPAVAPYGVQPTTTTSVYPTTSAPPTTMQPTAMQPVAMQPVAMPAAPTYYTTAQPVPPAAAQQLAVPQPTYYTAQQPSYMTPAEPRYQTPVATPAYARVAQQPTGTTAPGTPTLASAETLPVPAGGLASDAGAQGANDGLNGYAASDPGYNAAQGYNAAAGYNNGGAGCGCDDSGVSGYFDGCSGGSQWFGGVYGLYMTRSQPSYRPYTVGVDTGATGTPYYPAKSDVENMSDCTYLVPDWREGVEVRLGSTFGIGDSCDAGCGNNGCGTGGCDPCGCQPCCTPCCQQMYAWEVGWWGIDRDVQEQYVDGPLAGSFRYYGMVNYAGLQYDSGGGAQPVNDFYNYQIPITGPGAETVLAQRVRTNFSAQNLELNFMRLPFMSGCGSYDCCPPAFTLTGLCGLRYFRFDDDLEFGTEWADGGQTTFDGWGNGANELFHDIQMENQLVGFQLGANMNYCVATRWNFFWDTNFGIFNNHVNAYQRMYNPLMGTATFVQDGRDMNINSSKNDVAFLGEMRLGGGYSFTPHLRCVLAYRALGLTGVALAPDQIRPDYSNYATTALINADGSLIIHGIQAGFECNY